MARRFTISTDKDGWNTVVRRAKPVAQNEKAPPRKRQPHRPPYRPLSRIFTKPDPIASPDMLPFQTWYRSVLGGTSSPVWYKMLYDSFVDEKCSVRGKDLPNRVVRLKIIDIMHYRSTCVHTGSFDGQCNKMIMVWLVQCVKS